jgi:hypothetical protein
VVRKFTIRAPQRTHAPLTNTVDLGSLWSVENAQRSAPFGESAGSRAALDDLAKVGAAIRLPSPGGEGVESMCSHIECQQSWRRSKADGLRPGFLGWETAHAFMASRDQTRPIASSASGLGKSSYAEYS